MAQSLLMTSFFYICWIVLLLQIDLGYATVVNLALRKAALFCEELVESEKITDGDRNPTNSVYLESTCSPYTDLEIYLGKPYNIHYVIIYPGMTVSYTEGLHYCVIDLFGPGHRERCSEYPFKNIQPGVPMRINCQDHNKLFPKVLVTPHYDERALAIFDIAEIEVLTLALQNENYPLFHRGCYGHMEGVPEATTWENCQKKCFDGNYIFAAIKANSHCVCSNKLQESALRDDHECGIPCEGNRLCGGMNAFSVYIIKPPLPHYIGCYYHYWDETGLLNKTLIPIICLRYCKDTPFFAMMFGDRCKCLNEEPSEKRSPKSFCNKSCFGDERQGCGTHTGMNAYRTCIRSNSLTCNNIFRCKNEYDMYGVCISGCQTGFSGEYCLHKDFTINIIITTSTSTTTTTAIAITTEIATLRATLTNQSDDEDQRKTLLRQLRNILPFVIGGIITMCCLLIVCSASSEEQSSTSSTRTIE